MNGEASMTYPRGARVPFQVSQFYRNFASITAINPFPMHDSASRVQMLSQHLGQRLVTKVMTERNCQTGSEQEFGNFTFAVRMPVNGTILRFFNRYQTNGSFDSIKLNPETILVYEAEDTREIGMVSLPNYKSLHSHFGFDYVHGPGMSKIRIGAYIEKDTIFLNSPGVTKDGNYMFGTEVNVAYMSHPATAEDGLIMCEDIRDWFSFPVFETRTVEWGKRKSAINKYGSIELPKICPDIGETIGDDGILMVLRDNDLDLAVSQQSATALLNADHINDERVYAPAGGTVIDIRVTTNGDWNTDNPMDRQLLKYINDSNRFYKEIDAFIKKLRHERGEALQLTPQLNYLHEKALVELDRVGRNEINRTYKRAPVDTYRVEFVIRHMVVPNRGFKFTNFHGGKGVVCHFAKRSEMPVDADGNSADIVMAPETVANRMNPGAFIEMYINGAARDVAKRVRERLGVSAKDRHAHQKIGDIARSNPQLIDSTMNYLTGFYSLVAPEMERMLTNGSVSPYLEDLPHDQAIMTERVDHLTSVTQSPTNAAQLYMPPEKAPEYIEAIKELEKNYPQTYGPVSYIGFSGERVTTTEKVRIASQYIMALEKIGDDGSAVASSKTQIHGVIAQLNKTDKYSEPIRGQSAKFNGETETRLYNSYGGRECSAELMDRNNNPESHRHGVLKIIQSDNPTAIPELVDRTVIPFNNTKPLQIINHSMEVQGIEYRYKSQKGLENVPVPVAEF